LMSRPFFWSAREAAAAAREVASMVVLPGG
jgi:hypothetical protein